MIGGFDALFDDQFGRMVSLARVMGAPDPEDVAQEAFLKVHARWASIRDPAAAPAYLRRTVINLCRNVVWRHPMRRGDPVPDPAVVASAEAIAMDRHDVAQVLAAIDALPRRQREALVLRHWTGLSYDEVGNTLRTSAATARSLVHRARAEVHRRTGYGTFTQELI